MTLQTLQRMARWLGPSRKGGGAAWRTPVVLDRGILGEAALCLDDHGRGAALWENGGKLWTMPVGPHVAAALARLPLGEGGLPRLVMNPEGRGVALWTTRFGGDTQILGKVLGGDEGPQVIHRAEGEVAHLQGKVDRRGNALAVWVQKAGLGGRVLAQSFDVRGGTWEACPVVLGETSSLDRGIPRLAANFREHAMVLWTEEDGEGARLVASHFWPNERLWSDRPVPVVAHAVHSPQVAMDDQGNAVALWVHAPYRERASLEASCYDAARSEWGAPEILAQAERLSTPQLAMNRRGEALAAWSQSEGHGASRLISRAYTGGRWAGAPECLELGHDPIQEFAIDLDSEGRAGLVAVHQGPRGSWVSARLREGRWSEAQALAEASPSTCAAPLLRLCSQGASAMWRQGVGREHALYLGETW